MDAPASPFKGLAPFEASDLDALLFFGRERERELIVANLLASRLTVLYGPSGVGKSSLVRAGVAHRLLRELGPSGAPEYAVVVFDAWREDPWRALSAAMQSALAGRDPAATDLLLLLDQTEEYFLYHEHEDGPGTFAGELPRLVTDPSLRVSALLAIRDDALARLDRFKGRIPGVFSNYLRLDHLDRESARTAILGPLERYTRLSGETVGAEPALVEAVLDQTAIGRVDLGDRGRGGVRSSARVEAAYLQLVLRRLWDEERRTGSSTLRVETLERLGGAEQIVRTHLEHALDELDDRERDLAASVFRHLVTPSGSKIAHAVDDLADYADVDAGELQPVVTKLVEERILRPLAPRHDGQDGVPHEIFHDVLGEAVLAWRARHEQERRLETERRRHRRALAMAAVALAGLLAMTAIAVYALVQRRDARDAARTAHSQELVARSAAVLPVDARRSLELAVRAAELRSGSAAEGALRQALLADRLRRVLPLGGPVAAAQYAPDGAALLVTASGDVAVLRRGRVMRIAHVSPPVTAASFDPTGGRLLVASGRAVHVLDARTGAALATLRHRRQVTSASFGSSGRRILTGSSDRTAALWRARDGRRLRVLRAPGAVVAAVLAPDGRTVALAVRGRRGRVSPRLYRGPRLIRTLPQRGVTAMEFSPDSRMLATASADGTVDLWRARDGRLDHQLENGGSLNDVAFSPDGSMLATASGDGAVRVWDTSSGQRTFLFVGHGSGVLRVAFDPTGTYLASASSDRTARIWTTGGIEVGKLAALLAPNGGAVTAVAFSPDGEAVVTGSADGSARIWDARIEQQLRVVARAPGPVAAAAFSGDGAIADVAAGRVERRRGARVTGSFPLAGGVSAFSADGSLVASAGASTGVRVARVATGRALAELRTPGAVVALGFRADGRELVSASRGGVVRVWELPSGRPAARVDARTPVLAVALARSGSTIATGSDDGTVRLWRRDGKLLHVLQGHGRGQPITDARFSPDGKRLVTASGGSSENAIEWDVASGRPLHPLVGHFGTVTAASFSADGRWLLTSGPVAGAIWSSSSGALLFYLRGPTDLLTDAEWSRAGFRVVATTRDGTIRTYSCAVCGPLSDLMGLARRRLALR